MSMSVNSPFMAYAKSMEGKSLEGYSRLSSKVLRSKAGNSNAAVSDSQKSDEAENGRTGSVQGNSNTSNSNAEKKVIKRNSEIFYNNYLLKTSNDKSYEIDGVAFSAEEIEAVRIVVQNAVSPLSKGQIYYDYKDYAAMGIAESTVAKYAAENLTEEQAQAVNQSLSNYISNLLDKQNEWIESECYYDDTDGVGDTGEMNTYYGVRHNIPQKYLDEMRDFVLNSKNLPQDVKNTLAANIDATGRTGGIIYCASNKGLAGNVRSLFSGIDVTNASQLSEVFKQYKSMMAAAYKAAGFGNTTNSMLNNDTSSFTKQISNMKAVTAGVRATRVDSAI